MRVSTLIVSSVILCILTGASMAQSPSSAPPGSSSSNPSPLGEAGKGAASGSESPTVPPAGVSPAYRVLQDQPDRLIAQLPCRLIVIAQELRSAPVVSAQVWVKTGSIYEQEFVGAGLSHYLEHLVSGGSTPTRAEAQSNEILGRIGARTNAATGLDNVRYYVDTTSAFTSQAIELLTDWVRHCAIDEQEFERERQVIRKEFAMGRGEPGRILWRLTQQARYTAHPARHPTIGYLDEFEAVTRQQVVDFFRRMYVPNNMVFVVAGDIDRQAVVNQIAELWSDARPQPLPTLSLPIEAAIETPRELAGVADIRRPRLRLAWPGTKLAESGDFALDLLAVILGQGESSRLIRSVRDEQRLVTSISSYNLSFPWGQGFFGIDAEVVVPPAGADPKNPQGLPTAAIHAVKNAVINELARLRRAGITPEELARAKRQTLAGVIYRTQTASDLADRLASDLIGKADPDYLIKYAHAVQDLTAEQVLGALDRFIVDHRLITVTLMPMAPNDPSAELKRPPADPAAAQLPTEPIDLDNNALADRMRALATGRTEPRPAIVTETPQRFVLPNGLRVIVARSTLIPAVAMHMYQIGGSLADDPARLGLANAMSQMRIKGTATRSAQQIAQRIENLGASLTTSCGNNSFYTQALCLKDDWDAVLELLADTWISPAFVPEEWDKFKPLLLAAIDRQTDSWNGELRSHFLRAYFGDQHPWSRTVLGDRAVVEALTPEDLRRFHTQHLSAAETVLAIVGDVDPGKVVQRVTELFGPMPETGTVMFDAPIPPAPAPKIVQARTNKGLSAAQIGLGPGVTRASPDYAPLRVLGNALSSFPSGLLEQELRGRGPGLVYAVGAGPFTGVAPGYFWVIFNSDPGNTVKALSRSMALLDRVRSAPIDADALARAQAATLTDELFGKQGLGEQAADAALNWLYGLPEDESQRFIDDVNQATPELLHVIAQTYLRNPVVVVLSHQPLDDAELQRAAAATAASPEQAAVTP